MLDDATPSARPKAPARAPVPRMSPAPARTPALAEVAALGPLCPDPAAGTVTGAVNRSPHLSLLDGAAAVAAGVRALTGVSATVQTTVFDELAGAANDGAPAWASLDERARDEARRDLQARLCAYLERGRARVLITDNQRTMLSIKRGDGVSTFRLHHMFAGAPALVVRALARYAERKDDAATAVLRAYIDANDHRVVDRNPAAELAVDVEGRFHDLQAIFDELNQRYFSRQIRARITWGPRGHRRKGRRSIKLGSYTFDDALIRIHPVLDAADVPEFFVASVVHHEMLHEVHDIPVVGGRRVIHSRAFRADERRFEHFTAAMAWERANLHRLLDR